MKTAGKILLLDGKEVSDGNIDTCVLVSAGIPSTIMVPNNNSQNEYVTVKTLTSYGEPCISDVTMNIYAMVKRNVPVRSFTGPFQKCTLFQRYEESTLDAQLFNCTHIGIESLEVYVRISSQCSVSVCSIEVL